MSLNSFERLIKMGRRAINKRAYNKAIRIFYKVINENPPDELKVQAYIGLGDALRYEYELELAHKMYKKARFLIKILESPDLLRIIENKIENVYVMKKDREIKPVQIEFFMRGVMKLLSKFGKTDWF
ncbi:MAG: tetratricopeptide repeat protein [Candidatus Helarchaeota archaeon]